MDLRCLYSNVPRTDSDAVENGSMTAFLTDAGYWALIVFAFVQACCIPISSEITFAFAGVLAYKGDLNLALVIILGALAASSPGRSPHIGWAARAGGTRSSAIASIC